MVIYNKKRGTHLVHRGNGQDLDGGDLAPLAAPEQPGTRLPVLDIAHGDQAAHLGLWVRIVAPVLVGLRVEVPVDLCGLLLGGEQELGVVDMVLRQRDRRPEQGAVVAVDGLAGRLLVPAPGSVGDA
jgi:hypothetical protein